MKCPNCQTENRKGVKFCEECTDSPSKAVAVQTPPPSCSTPSLASPTDRCHQVEELLDQLRGRKRVYPTHDTIPDRDVAFGLTETEKPARRGTVYHSGGFRGAQPCLPRLP